ncbi:MAG: diguanylate cyclase [Magnetococcales bacterium]|nr:diguanylate cyclase [Magnetococcales bacterium]
MTSETTDFFETLYDLLRGNQPALGEAVALVEERMQKGVCQSELQGAKEQLLGILRLFKGFFSKNPKSQQQIAELIRTIETEGMLEQSAFKEALLPLIPPAGGRTSSRQSETTLPASFKGRLSLLLPETQATDKRDSDQLTAALTQLASAEGVHRESEPVAQERRWQKHLYLLGKGLSDAYPFGHLVDPATSQFFAGYAVDGSKRTSQKLEGLVKKQLIGYHRIAGSLKAKMEDGRQRAASLKQRVDQLEEALNLSQKALFIDPQTALPGRASFTAHLHRQLERAMHLGEVFSLALVQIQGFGACLKRLSEEESSHFIKTVASLIRSQVDSGDFLARLGVDRFVLIFPKTDQERSEAVATRVGDALNRTAYRLSQETVELQTRVGALTFEAGMTAQEMLSLTDTLAESAVEAPPEGGVRTVLNVREA